ncbi:gamma-glutamyl-gamma-aminobutyrate hydrolase PuuD [Amycolatopsis bartoniae]|uniref:Glutamine amidotransferase n=1 Tax=Amycolatopsis bartoniae TaxID=941986 RepID=A0A8H9MBX4_9PSEU|nr:gamma-glutamyl-gamma-aminobutyrate hydrolase family protein [Amycolatopsis bartoniae]MBB2934211.1 gamma-glutamyl-gamma-aminobutyrate hydrolase PuuD [Amycolatopsis bartoniae]TVT08420.1 gamma-glutamyl-gamma-aminobutyrate hydrolase family protein [Amycolatopsis bartoniae]GHF49067.1 glutamine amidotransferase [Amycolatopsis bartoniae]
MVSSGSKPIIGLSTYVEQARWGVWDTPAALLPRSYVDAVVNGGGIPVLLPSVGEDTSALSAVDALVITGGADVDPARYGRNAHEKTVTRPERDGFEFALTREALDRGLPILGVCRGIQVLNVALGGTLIQHLPDAVGHADHQPGPASYGHNRITLAEGSRAAEILGAEAKGHCYHHQAIDALGTGLRAVGWAADGTVEAVELPGERFVLGVQWHPEQDIEDVRLFAALVEASCR